MRGRKPQPTQVQIAKGDPSKRGKGKLEEKLAAEPIAAKGLPDAPAHLTGVALAAYNFWREELAAMNLDARPDAMMLEGACVNYERATLADAMVRAEGITIEVPIFSKEGDELGSRTKNHPAISTSNQAWKNVKAFCSEFGLSPVSRTRLAIEKTDDEEKEVAAILNQPRLAKEAIQ